MPTYKANKAEGETHDIPDDEVIVGQETVGGIETITTRPQDESYECGECGKTFDSQNGLNGHKAVHTL